jgi:hypothetical protein
MQRGPIVSLVTYWCSEVHTASVQLRSCFARQLAVFHQSQRPSKHMHMPIPSSSKALIEYIRIVHFHTTYPAKHACSSTVYTTPDPVQLTPQTIIRSALHPPCCIATADSTTPCWQHTKTATKATSQHPRQLLRKRISVHHHQHHHHKHKHRLSQSSQSHSPGCV